MIRTLRFLAIAAMLSSAGCGALCAEPLARGEPQVRALRITVLSTMLAGNPMFKGIGEWGFAALVEVDGRRILFDTGLRPETVLRNARELGIDLGDITDVILSHNHADHTGGLLTLRREFSAKNPAALSRVHVAPQIFWSRGAAAGGNNGDENVMVARRAEYEGTGGKFIEHAAPTELVPGVWFTGPIARKFPERNWGGTDRVRDAAGAWIADNVPEDSALVFDTTRGLVVLCGCGHAGVINTLEFARTAVRTAPIHAAIGGFHLFNANEESLAWTSTKLREFGLAHLLAGHCTGIEASHRIRELARLTRETATVAAVGSTFDLARGIDPLLLAR